MIFLPDFFAEVKKLEQEMKDLLDRAHPGAEGVGAAPYTNLVPLDETIDAVLAVGRAMPPELRCTSQGGLAVTPSARALKPDRLDL